LPASKRLERYIVFHIVELARRFLGVLALARGGGLFRFPGTCVARPLPAAQHLHAVGDDFVGHRRRYEPEDLKANLARHGFTVERSAVFGMKPRSSRLVDLGMWFLLHQGKRAMRLYNRVLMPLGVRFQKPLALAEGLIDTAEVGEVLLLCRRRSG